MMQDQIEPAPEDFGISYERGFLPALDPLPKLPYDYSCYDDFGKQLPDFLGAGIVRARAKELESPKRPVSELSEREQLLLMLRLSFIANAFVFQNSHIQFAPKRIREAAPTENEIVIPANLSRIFVETADELGIPPILSYSFYSLYNWEKLNPRGEIEVSNLRPLQIFHGGLDERHFIVEHIEIENNLSRAVHLGYTIQGLTSGTDHMNTIRELLSIMAESIRAAVGALHNMQEACHTDIYYIRVRPFIFGFNNLPGTPRVIFDGLEDDSRRIPVLRGETGAQTPSFPALWSAMGIEFSEDGLKQHVLAMREYFLPRHREYIETIDQRSSIRQYVLRLLAEKVKHSRLLRKGYNDVVMALYNFSNLHCRYADIYIAKKYKKYTLHKEQANRGTGDTRFMEYLLKHRDEIKAHVIR